MELKAKHMILTAIFCFLSLSFHAQSLSQHPPEPRMQDQGGPDPCGQDDGGTTTPPVGLCLPVDNYLYPFLILAVIYGSYKMSKIKESTI